MPRDPYYNTKPDFGGRKDKWYHNVGEFFLDPRNIGTAVGGYFGGAPGAAAGGSVGGMIPGVNLGPEDDARQSSLEGDFGEVVGGVAMDAARGYGGYKLGEFAGEQLQGAFANPAVGGGVGEVAISPTTGAALPNQVGYFAGDAGSDVLGQEMTQQIQNVGGVQESFSPFIPTDPVTGAAGQMQGLPEQAALPFGRSSTSPTGYAGIDATTATQNLGQAAANAPVAPQLSDPGMSVLEKAYLISQIGATAANFWGNKQEQDRYNQSMGPGNMFDAAMTSAFSETRRSPGVTSYQDYLKRIG